MTIAARNALAILGLGLLAACGGSAETPPATPSAPSPPTGVVATAGLAQVTVSWTASAGATSYNVYYSTSASVSKASGTRATGATSGGAITGLAPGTTYYVVVTALNQGGESAESSPAASATTQPPYDGTWAVCRNDGSGSTDYRELLTITGSDVTFDALVYLTTDASCDGDGVSGTPQVLTAALGGQVSADLGGGSVLATQVDLTLAGPPPETFYTLVYRDTDASPDALHLGDDAGVYDGSTPLLRPIALQTMARALQTAPVGADLTGDWRFCPAAGGEIVTIDAAARSFDLKHYDGTCGAGTITEHVVATYTLATPVYASLDLVTVTAFAVDLAVTQPVAQSVYTTIWVDTEASPRRLYHGDASLHGMDGSSAALRSRVLLPDAYLKQ